VRPKSGFRGSETLTMASFKAHSKGLKRESDILVESRKIADDQWSEINHDMPGRLLS